MAASVASRRVQPTGLRLTQPISIFVAAVCGPIAAFQFAAQPAQPWEATPLGVRVLVIASLAFTAAAIVLLAAAGRWRFERSFINCLVGACVTYRTRP